MSPTNSSLYSSRIPFSRRGMPSASGISPHAKRTLFEYLQPQGHQLNVFLPLVSLPVLCVCACLFDHPSPYAPSLSQCPQLSSSVRDHRGKSFVQPKPPGLGGPPMEVRVPHPSPKPQARIAGPCGARSVELCTGVRMMHAEGQRRREGPFPQAGEHSLTHSLYVRGSSPFSRPTAV